MIRLKNGDQDPFLQALFAWSLANDVTRDLQLYITGTNTYPTSPSDLLAGVGLMWTVNERVATYGLLASDFGIGTDAAEGQWAHGRWLSDGMAQIGISWAF